MFTLHLLGACNVLLEYTLGALSAAIAYEPCEGRAHCSGPAVTAARASSQLFRTCHFLFLEYLSRPCSKPKGSKTVSLGPRPCRTWTQLRAGQLPQSREDPSHVVATGATRTRPPAVLLVLTLLPRSRFQFLLQGCSMQLNLLGAAKPAWTRRCLPVCPSDCLLTALLQRHTPTDRSSRKTNRLDSKANSNQRGSCPDSQLLKLH